MSDISKTFRALSERREGALIAYAMGGDPRPEVTPLVVDALVEGGADIIELGIPFSDPIADGPSIQAAGVRALSAGTTPSDVLRMAAQVKTKHDVPVVLMTYYNILYHRGLERFLGEAHRNGVDGVIVPDLPLDEIGAYSAESMAQGVDTVLLAAPTTSDSRMRLIAKSASGFLYLVSVLGVTGARSELQQGTVELVRRAKRFTKNYSLPLAVGFGISRPEHVRAMVEAGAEGVIVGSGIVDIVAKNRDDPSRMGGELREYATQLKAATLRHA